MAKKILKQPTEDEQRMLKDVTNANTTTVLVRNKKWNVGWMRNGTLDHLSRIMLKANETEYEDNPVKSGAEENKVVCKCAAVLKLNGYWSIKFLYWIVWRWFYYFKQYSEDDLGEFIAECKKKVPVMSYLMCTTLLTAMMDTKKQMNRQEVNRIQAEQLSAQRAALAKNTEN